MSSVKKAYCKQITAYIFIMFSCQRVPFEKSRLDENHTFLMLHLLIHFVLFSLMTRANITLDLTSVLHKLLH